jgi:DNA-binding IclR family transcriptional regulator
MGRALLAFSGSAMVESTICRGLRAYTDYTVTSPERFRRSVAVTRLTRVALSRWELEFGVCAAAMPVFGPGGYVVAALELSLADLSSELGSNISALTIASRSLSRELAGDARSTSGPLGMVRPEIRISAN